MQFFLWAWIRGMRGWEREPGRGAQTPGCTRTVPSTVPRALQGCEVGVPPAPPSGGKMRDRRRPRRRPRAAHSKRACFALAGRLLDALKPKSSCACRDWCFARLRGSPRPALGCRPQALVPPEPSLDGVWVVLRRRGVTGTPKRPRSRGWRRLGHPRAPFARMRGGAGDLPCEAVPGARGRRGAGAGGHVSGARRGGLPAPSWPRPASRCCAAGLLCFLGEDATWRAVRALQTGGL